MIYQLSWQTLPGLEGLSCSNFRAVATTESDPERGVTFESATEGECATLLKNIEEHFAGQRFSNSAAAFETVKAYVLERAGRRG